MNKFIYLISCLIGVGLAQNATKSNIYYEKPDLNTTANYITGPVYIEAFKSIENDRILKDGNTSEYGKLEWYSLGAPKLYKTLCVAANKSFLFHLGGLGFHTFVNSLQVGQRRVLAQEASNRLSVPISSNQIKNIPLSRIDCYLYFNETGSGRTYLIKGSGANLDSVAHRINFRAPSDAYERIIFEKRDENNSQPLKLECQYWAGKISEKSTPLVITPTQFKTLDIIKKVHGNIASVLMTRQQLLNLADFVYRSLRILDYFRVPEFEFAEEFIQLITKNEKFTLVPFDQAIKSMSRYSLDPKLRLENINKEIAKIFKVGKVGEMSVIQLSGKLNKSLAVVVGWKSQKAIREYQEDWVETKRELEAQLYDVNYWASSEVEWKFAEGVIAPKSIGLVKINKSVFQNSFKFLNINKTLIKADYTKVLKLNANF